MHRSFVNARSPLRLLEKGLHGGLGAGNVGVVLAGRGVGKTPFLVGVALDELLRGKRVLHVSFDDPVAHVREHYDTVFDELAASTQLEDLSTVRTDVERNRSIRVYPAGGFSTAKLREAVKFEREAGPAPALVLLDAFDLDATAASEFAELRAFAQEIDAEIWLSVACPGECVPEPPAALARVADSISVVLALEPGAGGVSLRALKDHDNPDVSALHVALDPRTLLLVRT